MLSGRPLTVDSNAEVGSFDYLYDTAGRLTQVTRPDLKTVGHGYDAAGNQTRLTYPDASFVTYVYDELGRMTEVRDGGTTLLAQYTYDPLSRLTTTTYDNGAQTSHVYELDDDLSQVAQSYGVGAVTFDYLYNLVNQRTDTTVDDNAYLWFPDLAASNSYLANALNQYDDVDSVPFTYDGNGNLTGDGVDTYLYDVESRLVTAITALTDYTYDPFGRRGEKDVGGTVTRYVYAGDTVIAEYDGLDQLQARYIPGLGIDRPVLMDRGATLSYYHYDGTGSVIAMTDVFGTVVEAYAFGPYGESADGDALGNPYRYSGRRLDPETGLYYYRARYYSASLGRFLQADPAGYIDGLNLYAYVRNDPLNLVDPSGLVPQNGGRSRWDVLSTGIRQPRYDTVDAVALDPGGPGATGFVTTDLHYSLDAGVSYWAGITLANIDRGFWSDLNRMIVSSAAPFSGSPLNSNEVNVRFDATIRTADGTYTSSFKVTGQLAVDGWLYVPIWRDIGPLQGPGTVDITVTNQSPYTTAVTVGANQEQ